MKVAILGCGAMGTVLGAYMTKNGCDVEMIDSYQAHVDALNEKGAHIVGTVDFTVPVKAVTRADGGHLRHCFPLHQADRQ